MGTKYELEEFPYIFWISGVHGMFSVHQSYLWMLLQGFERFHVKQGVLEMHPYELDFGVFWMAGYYPLNYGIL